MHRVLHDSRDICLECFRCALMHVRTLDGRICVLKAGCMQSSVVVLCVKVCFLYPDLKQSQLQKYQILKIKQHI